MLKDNQWLMVRKDKQSGLLVFALYERKFGTLWVFKQSYLSIIDSNELLTLLLERLQRRLAVVIQQNLACGNMPLAVIEHGEAV